MKILLDTNILIRVRDTDSAHHPICAEVLRKISGKTRQGCLCAQVMIEYWAVATRPKESNGLGMTTEEAGHDLRDFKLLFDCLPEAPDMANRWEQLVLRHNVSGRQAHDARIVALMESNGVSQILTLNVADFTRFPQVQVLTPQIYLNQFDAS